MFADEHFFFTFAYVAMLTMGHFDRQGEIFSQKCVFPGKILHGDAVRNDRIHVKHVKLKCATWAGTRVAQIRADTHAS